MSGRDIDMCRAYPTVLSMLIMLIMLTMLAVYRFRGKGTGHGGCSASLGVLAKLIDWRP